MSVSDRPRVGLVLGAGGILGGAWLVGALHAIAGATLARSCTVSCPDAVAGG